MLIDFNGQQERKAPVMNNGTGEMSAKMYMDDNGKIIPCRIHKGGSIGMHKHPTSDDINYSTFPAQITEHCLNKYWLGCHPVVNFTFQYFCDIG